MKKYLLTIMCLFILSSVAAQQIDHTFTYQGELLENSTPVTGLYNFKIEGFDAAGNSKTNVSEHLLILVTDGLFTIPDVNLGVVGLDAYATFLQISVKPGVGVGTYTDLTPRQSLKSVPYATKVIDGNATNGQVYTFSTTGGWGPADPVAGSSPWTVTGSSINYLGNVGIGTNTPNNTLHVKSPFDDTAIFDGAQDMFVSFAEDGVFRGYVGSFVSGTGVNDADFEIGTYFNNTTGGLQFTIQNTPKMTITNDGDVGINAVSPNADLNISGTNDGDLFRIQQDTLTNFGNTAFYVDDNGGASVGSWTSPPALGLRVQGNTRQSITSNGMIKFMVHASCSSTASISKQYNGVNTSGNATIAAGGLNGLCTITFPFDISDRFYQVSSVEDLLATNATCQISASGAALNCARHRSNTGALLPGQIMILVY